MWVKPSFSFFPLFLAVFSRADAFAPSLTMGRLAIQTDSRCLADVDRSLVRPSSSASSRLATATSSAIPSLIVFDLDNTVWTPELYKLRELQRMKITPRAHRDVQLFPAAKKILTSLRTDERFSGTKLAVASRTKSVEWAHDLLRQFGLIDIFDHVEIFPGDKTQHFRNLREQSGVDYGEMLFFDDARDGRYGNCLPVSELGVLSVHCPNGLDWTQWEQSLSLYTDRSSTPDVRSGGAIVEWDGSVTAVRALEAADGLSPSPSERFEGKVKMVNFAKQFGFIQYGGRKTKDIFFHFNSLNVQNARAEMGDVVTFSVVHDERKGKLAAANVEINAVKGGSSGSDSDTIQMRAFSMNLPFAALLANEYKTLESRNGTMFVPYPPGTKMLLHVGQRTYPDGDRHVDIMKSGGLNDDEIEKLKSLPDGYGRGMAVAIAILGETYETTLEERCDPDFQRSVGAFGADSGMRVTEIRRVEYLKKPVKVSGQGGVFKTNIDKEVIPDGWLDE